MVTPVAVTFNLAPAGNGRATCQLSNRMRGAGQTVETVPVVAILEAGQGTAHLWANDDPATAPQGTSWEIKVTIGGQTLKARQVIVLADQAPTVDYSALGDAAPVTAPVQLVVGPTGPAAGNMQVLTAPGPPVGPPPAGFNNLAVDTNDQLYAYRPGPPPTWSAIGPQPGAATPPGGPAKYPHLYAGLARVRAGLGDMRWLEAGDSTVYGYAGAGVPAGLGSGSAVVAHLAGRGYPAALGGSIPNAIGDAALENDPRWVASAAWAPLQGFAVGWANGNASWGATGITAADTLTFTPSGPALYDSADIYYFRGGGMGSFDARANAQAATTINATVPPGSIGKATITFPATANPVIKFGNTTGYTMILEVEPFHSAVPRVRVANAGVSGSTTTQWATVSAGGYGPLDTIKAYAPDVTVFRSGANDAVVGGGITVAAYLANLAVVGNAAKVSGDFFVSSPAPIVNSPALIAAYTAPLPAFCAANGFGYIPLGERWGSWAGLSPLGFYAGPSGNPDGEHPSTLGYTNVGDLEAATLLGA